MLLDELDSANNTLRRKKRQLRQMSLCRYWTTAVDIVQTETTRNSIRKQISVEQFKTNGGTAEEWRNTEEAQSLECEKEILKLKERKFLDQLRRLQDGGEAMTTTLSQRRSYLELFLSSNRGLGVVSGAGKRGSDDQCRFRQDLIQAYNSTNPQRGWEEALWCPVLSAWCSMSNVTASHIFSYKHGQ